jgi:hypothetical protein
MPAPDDKVEVRCPKCDHRLRFAMKFMGRNGLCPLCGASFKIAPPEGAAPQPAPQEDKSKSEAWKISTYFRNPPPKK